MLLLGVAEVKRLWTVGFFEPRSPFERGKFQNKTVFRLATLVCLLVHMYVGKKYTRTKAMTKQEKAFCPELLPARALNKA